MSEPREGRWTAKPMKPRYSYLSIQTFFAVLYAATLLSFLALHPGRDRLPFWLSLLNGVGFLVIGLLWSANEIRCLRAAKADRFHMESPKGGEAYLVEIAVAFEGKALGCDRGVLYFDGPHVGFVGKRTSFFLAAGDLTYSKAPSPFDFDVPVKPLELRVEGRRGNLTVKPLLGYRGGYRRRMRAFLRASEASDAPRQWPPSVPYDGSEAVPPLTSTLSPNVSVEGRGRGDEEGGR